MPILAALVNRGFEHSVLREAPPGWLAWPKFRRFRFEVATTNERLSHGTRAAVVRRDVSDVIGEASGSVKQRIDATAYRGRRVRLRVHAPEYINHDIPEMLYDSLDKYRVTSPVWRVFEIEADVPDEAGMIKYGLYLADAGAAWLDDVSLKVVEEYPLECSPARLNLLAPSRSGNGLKACFLATSTPISRTTGVGKSS